MGILSAWCRDLNTRESVLTRECFDQEEPFRDIRRGLFAAICTVGRKPVMPALCHPMSDTANFAV